MNTIGAFFTITLLILILVWPFLAIVVDRKVNSKSTRSNSTPSEHDYLDPCSTITPKSCSCKQRRYAE